MANSPVGNSAGGLFSPPSEAEVKMFAPPTPQELVSSRFNQRMDSDQAAIDAQPAKAAKAAVDLAPAIGSTAGGLLGGVPGAFVGGAVGKNAQTMINNKQAGKPLTTLSDLASDTFLGGAEGAAQEYGSQIIGKGLQYLKAPAKAGVNEITAAASRLGIDPTPGMLSGSKVAQDAESITAQNPAIAAGGVRQEVGDVYKGLQNTAKDLVSGASDASKYQVGGEAAKSLTAGLGEKYNNVQMAYEPFNDELPKMVPDNDAKELLASRITKAGQGNLSLSSNVEAFGNKVAEKVSNAKSLADIEDIRKQVSSALSTAYRQGDYNAVDGISKIEDHLNDFRDNQFETLASKNGPSAGGEGAKIGQSMVDQYKQAQGTYKDLMGQIKQVGPALGIKAKNPQGFIEAINNIPEEKLATQLSNPKYVDAAQTIKENFPDTFENVRQFKIGQIQEKSLTNGEIDPAKFVRETNKLSPEFKQMIFGDKASKLDDMETVLNSLPDKAGPSGTPAGIMAAKGAFSPSNNIGALGSRATRSVLTNPTIQQGLTPQNIQNAGRGAAFIGRSAFDKAKGLIYGNQ